MSGIVIADSSPLIGLARIGQLDLLRLLYTDVLLIDERKGRGVATRRGVPIDGIGAVLLAAKRYGHIQSVAAELGALKKIGYRLSDTLVRKLLVLVGE